MRRLLIIPFVTLIAIGAALVAFNLGAFHASIESAMAGKLNAQVKLGHMSLFPRWPLAIDIDASRVISDAYTLQWRQLKIEIASLVPPYAVTLTWLEPQFAAKGELVMVKKPEGPGQSKKTEGGFAAPLRLKMNITRGDLQIPSVHLTAVEVDFEQKLLLRSAAKLHFKALVEAQRMPIKIPVTVDSENLTLSPETVKATDLKVSFGGLLATAAGTSILGEDRHRWTAAIEAPDLAKLPHPPMEIPAVDWKGSIHLSAEIKKEGPTKNWSVDGDLRAEKVSANIKYVGGKLALQGPVDLSLQSHFTYQNLLPVISNLTGDLDLTQTHVVYQDILQKAPGVAMRVGIKAQGDLDNLQLESFASDLWKFAGKVSGRIKLTAPYVSSLHFEVPAFSLTGAEKIFLPLAKSPVTGDMGLRGNIDGPLMEPLNCHFLIDSFLLKNFAAYVAYDKPGFFKVTGPVKLSLEGRGEFTKAAIKQAEIKGRVNLNDAALVAGPLRKEAKQNLAVEIQARNVADTLEIQNLSMESFAGRMKLTGKIKNLFDPTMKLKVELQSMNLSELRMALPEIRDKIPKGTLAAEVYVSGRRDSDKPWSDWPLDIDGWVKLSIPEYTMASPPPVKEVKDSGSKKQPLVNSSELLPNGYLTSHLRLKVAADLGTVVKDKLQIKGIHTDGMIASGHFKGLTEIKEIFSGTIQASGLDVALLQARPTVQGAVKWSGIVIEDALGFAKPDYKDLATGRMAGTTEFQTYLPADSDFMNFLKAKGELNMQPITLNSVRLGQMINDLLKQMPMVKMQPVKMDPLKGSLKSQFDLRYQTLQIENLDARDLDGSELQLKGKVVVTTMQGDFVGNFFWATQQVKGCLIEGNSDAAGRMVIPMAIKGDLMHPGLAAISDMVGKIGAKALSCEQQKLLDRVKKDGTKQIEDEVKKKLKGFFGK